MYQRIIKSMTNSLTNLHAALNSDENNRPTIETNNSLGITHLNENADMEIEATNDLNNWSPRNTEVQVVIPPENNNSRVSQNDNLENNIAEGQSSTVDQNNVLEVTKKPIQKGKSIEVVSET